jgi:hypothetical protein
MPVMLCSSHDSLYVHVAALQSQVTAAAVALLVVKTGHWAVLGKIWT